MRARNKHDLGANIQNIADSRVAQAFQLAGKALPVSVVEVKGAIVICKFEILSDELTLPMVTVPVGISRYMRLPIQVGDVGVVFPCDVALGGIDGLGTGTADLSSPPNLTSLVFFPIGNSAWPDVDAAAVVNTAPNGVELKDDSNVSKFKLTPEGIDIVTPKFTLKVSGTGDLEFTGDLKIKSPSITLEGNVIINGNLSQGMGEGGGTATLSGPLNVQKDVTANGISVSGHTHPVPQGGNTGKPQ